MSVEDLAQRGDEAQRFIVFALPAPKMSPVMPACIDWRALSSIASWPALVPPEWPTSWVIVWISGRVAVCTVWHRQPGGVVGRVGGYHIASATRLPSRSPAIDRR